jgi:hypothetical protein
MADNITDKISRRDFLKIGSMVIAGASLTGCSWGKEVSESEKKPTFLEVNRGDPLPLKLPGKNELQYVSIDYHESDERLSGKLQIRMVDEKIVTPLSFDEGKSRIRKVGEVLDTTLYKVKKSDKLSSGYTVGVYPNAEPPITSLTRMDLPENKELYGISVITSPIDYMKEGELPLEVNGNTYYSGGLGGNDNNLKYFGKGFAVGLLSEDSKKFEVLGYVNDARALDVIS